MDELRAIRIFAQAAQAGSFARVAADEGISPQAVSKAIAQLERHLGLRLFHRTTRQNALTEEGLAFLESVRPGLDAMAAAIARVRTAGEGMSGPIRVTAAHSARKVLAEPINAFCEMHPDVRIELMLADGPTDIVAEKIDVGFRSGSMPRGQVVARQLFAIQQVLCASPDYARAHGLPRKLSELALHRCTAFRHSGTGRLLPWELKVDGEITRVEVPAHFCSNDPEAEVEAVAGGQGIGLIDAINAAEPLREGRLIAFLPELATDHLGFFIYYPQRQNMPRRVRSFIDFMVARLLGSTAFHIPASRFRKRLRGG